MDETTMYAAYCILTSQLAYTSRKGVPRPSGCPFPVFVVPAVCGSRLHFVERTANECEPEGLRTEFSA